MAGIVFSGIKPRQPRWPCLSNTTTVATGVEVILFWLVILLFEEQAIKIKKQTVVIIFIDEGILNLQVVFYIKLF